MSALLPILAAFLQASSITLDKVALSVKRVDFGNYIGVSFPLIFVINLIIFGIFRPEFSTAFLSGNLLLWLGISVFISVCTNVLYYRALDQDKLTEMEIISLMTGVPIILTAGIIFTDERNVYILIPALIASVAVVWAHWKHGKMLLKKNTRPFLIWTMILAPLGAVASKILLEHWNPISRPLSQYFLPFMQEG
jgi:drug/metabolite transporter (DMT)-like permease